MKKRVLTACIGVPFLVFVLAHGGWLAEVVIVLLAAIAMNECYRALRSAGYNICVWGGYIAVLCMWPFSRIKGGLDPLLLVTGAMGISITGVLLSKDPTFPNAAASVYPLFTALLPMSMFLMMMNRSFGTVPGAALVTLAFAVAFLGDAAAFFGGKAVGKHKLCPEISPNKTVEGAAFYTVAGILGCVIVRTVLVQALYIPMPGLPASVLLGFLGAIAGQIGDLSASLLKRYSGIKDYGHVFPGHGGVMDRFDSVIFTLIVFYCYTLVLTI